MYKVKSHLQRVHHITDRDTIGCASSLGAGFTSFALELIQRLRNVGSVFFCFLFFFFSFLFWFFVQHRLKHISDT